MASDAQNALKNWEVENSVMEIDTADAIYKFDRDENQRQLNAKRWASECVFSSGDGLLPS